MSMYNGPDQSYSYEQNRLGQLQQNQNNLWSNYTQPQYQLPRAPAQVPSMVDQGYSTPQAQYAPPQPPNMSGQSGYGGSGLSTMYPQQTATPQRPRVTQQPPPAPAYNPKPFDSLTGQASYDYYDKISKQNPYVQAPTGYGDYMTQKTGTPWVNPNPDTMDFSSDYYNYFDGMQKANPDAGYVVPRGYNTWKSQQP